MTARVSHHRADAGAPHLRSYQTGIQKQTQRCRRCHHLHEPPDVSLTLVRIAQSPPPGADKDALRNVTILCRDCNQALPTDDDREGLISLWREEHPAPSFVCPVCGRTTWHSRSAERGFCTTCKEQTGPDRTQPAPAGTPLGLFREPGA